MNSIVKCSYSEECSNKPCLHRFEHEERENCSVPCSFGKGIVTKCVPVPQKVICSGASKCKRGSCRHLIPHEQNDYCGSSECEGKEVQCVPYDSKNPPVKTNDYTLTMKEHPDNQKITIQAKNKLEAYEKALESLGWELN